MTTRVMIVDDQRTVREGLGRLLGEADDIEIVADAASGEEALELMAAARPDVVLLDLSMPRQSGVATLHDLRRRFPSVRVLMLSVHPEDQFGPRALAAGACGYMGKELADRELLGAVRHIHKGGRFVSPHLAEILARRLYPQPAPPAHEGLSEREFEVFLLLVKGRTVAEIAQRLHLRLRTIAHHRRQILEKLHLAGDDELVRYALQHHLLSR